jgi:hypothetical protein
MSGVRAAVRHSAGKDDHRRPRRLTESEPPLRANPAAFHAVFGDCQYPAESVRKLMAAVALVTVKDYFVEPDRIKNRLARARAIADRRAAERYIFDRKADVGWQPFSFGAVCKALNIDPDFARRGIRRRSPDDIKGIVQRIVCHRADWDDD